MGRLFIVAGASGAGKSFLLQTATELVHELVPIRKLTTRGPRDYETPDIRQALDLNFKQAKRVVQSCDYRYPYGDHWYGIRVEDIETSLAEGKYPMVIVRNADTIRRLKSRYNDAVVLWLQSGLSGEDLAAKLREQGRPDIEIDARMRRLEWDFHDYISILRNRLVDHVLVNYYDRDRLVEQLQSILLEELESPPTDPFLVFVLISFSAAMRDSYRAIKTAGKLVEQVPLEVTRLDDAGLVDYRITDEIIAFIRKAGVIVCDLSEERPNVYYELGFARGLGKRVISCARADTRLHFDIKDFHTIQYQSPMELQEELTKVLIRLYGGRG